MSPYIKLNKLCPHKLNSDIIISEERSREAFYKRETSNLPFKLKITANFQISGSLTIASPKTVRFKSLLSPFIATNSNIFVRDIPPFQLLYGSFIFFNTLTCKNILPNVNLSRIISFLQMFFLLILFFSPIPFYPSLVSEKYLIKLLNHTLVIFSFLIMIVQHDITSSRTIRIIRVPLCDQALSSLESTSAFKQCVCTCTN